MPARRTGPVRTVRVRVCADRVIPGYVIPGRAAIRRAVARRAAPRQTAVRGVIGGRALAAWAVGGLAVILVPQWQPPLAGQWLERPADRECRRCQHHGPAAEDAFRQ